MTTGTLKARVATVLCSYRITPQTTTGVSPSELLFGKRLRTRLDLVKPNLARRVESKQLQQMKAHDVRAKARIFASGSLVYVRNFGQGQRWSRGQNVKSTGPVSYVVQMEGGMIRRCHQDQLRSRFESGTQEPEPEQEVEIFLEVPSESSEALGSSSSVGAVQQPELSGDTVQSIAEVLQHALATGENHSLLSTHESH